jgi:tripartite-type tricarboxylate transporter receptor subunit TctC
MTASLRCLLIASAIIAIARPARADEVTDFYRDKTFTIVVGHEVGTGFDVYARALQRHFGRHLPGNPNVVVQNMPGASGVNAANWLYNSAPKDGSMMATFVYAVPFEPLMGNRAARYEAAKFTWIGNVTESIQVCGASKAAGIDRFDDLRTREIIVGGTATTGPLTKSALAVRNLLGAKMKIVAGYKGSADLKLAIGRGEVQGVCGLQLSTIKSAWREDYESGNFRPIIQLSGRKQAALAIPHIDDYPGSNDERQVRALIFGMQSLGGLYASAPGIPAARKKALRAALLATMRDPQFVADAAKIQIDISPMTGAEVEAFIARVSTASPATVERAKQAFAP